MKQEEQSTTVHSLEISEKDLTTPQLNYTDQHGLVEKVEKQQEEEEEGVQDGGEDVEGQKGTKQQLEFKKVGMPSFLKFLSTSTSTTPNIFYKNQSDNSTIVDYSDLSDNNNNSTSEISTNPY